MMNIITVHMNINKHSFFPFLDGGLLLGGGVRKGKGKAAGFIN